MFLVERSYQNAERSDYPISYLLDMAREDSAPLDEFRELVSFKTES
jgi:hypothetical protein